jgi:RNA polymerase sigma-70 factor (sigma-E family)
LPDYVERGSLHSTDRLTGAFGGREVSVAQQSFDVYVTARTEGLLRYAFVLTGDSHLAEDIVQEALLKLSWRWGSVIGLEHPDAYVRRTVTNAFLSSRRRRRVTEVSMPSTDLPQRQGGTEVSVERQALWERVLDLPARERAAVVLRYYEDLDDTEIAQVMSCAPATVRSHISHALARLRASDPARTSP